jgi:hypothetical protein
MKQIGAAIAIYADAYDNWLPFYGGRDPNFEPPFKCKVSSSCPWDESHPYAAFRANTQWEDVNGVPIPMKLACLYAAGIITDASVFYCPANPDPAYQYESYTNPPPWGTLPQEFNTRKGMGQWVRLGYTYFPTDPNVPKETNGNLYAPKWTARRYDGLSTQIPYLADVLWSREQISHKTENGYSLNALFKDGHVVYCKDERFFSDSPDKDPQRLWYLWEPRMIKFNMFYYNFLKKIGP